MKKQPFTVGIIQDTASNSVEDTVERHATRVREAAAQGAQIICLQEMYNSQYFCKRQSHDRFDLAEPIPGPSTTRMQELARELGVVIIVPIFEQQALGLYRNSAAVYDADGEMLGVYRKMHIPDDPLFNEKFYFTPGDVLPPSTDEHPGINGFHVWRTKFADVGLLICWDQWYPEAARITALLGADIIFYPTAIGWHPSEKEEYGQAQVDAWQIAQRAHAIANGVFVAAPNRVGHEDEEGTEGVEFFGHSFICDPFGRMLVEGGTEPEILIAKCDPALINETRTHWPFLRDRRVDAYSPILSRYIGSK